MSDILWPAILLVLFTLIAPIASRMGRPQELDAYAQARANREALLVDPLPVDTADLLFYVLIAFLIASGHQKDFTTGLLSCVYVLGRLVQFSPWSRETTWSRYAGMTARVVLIVMWMVFAFTHKS